jgi:hypothetical protein
MTEHCDALPVLVIDGARFSGFDGFTREFCRLLDNHTWHGNLDAFNDLLRGGSGTPESGWALRWLNSELSRSALGYEAATQRLEQLLLTCHSSNRLSIEGQDPSRAEQPGSNLVRRDCRDHPRTRSGC